LNASPTLRTTGIIVALAAEAHTLVSRNVTPERVIPLADGAALYLSGMGPAAARRAAQQLADAGVSALSVFGVAGALGEPLRNGALFCPERVLDEEGHAYPTDAEWQTRLQQQLSRTAFPVRMNGTLLTTSAPLLTAAAKLVAHQRHGALAVDMESAAVAAVARERGLPFMALRAIVDEAQDTIPPALNGSVDAWGRARPLRLMAALCAHPLMLGDLPRLYSRMQRATQALRAAAHATGPTLGWSR